jgi:hypothetical protein
LERPPHSLQRSQLISERSQRHEGDRLGPPIADLDGDARYWLDRSRLDQPCLCAASQSNHPTKFGERRPFAKLTLRDAGEFITRLPKTKHARPEWRLAAVMLMQAAEDGAPVMLAEIAMRRALNADGEPEPPTPRRKRAKKYRIVR